jgi:plasmid replication initiation protein
LIRRINEAVENDLKTSPTISFQPYDLLKSIGRQTGGDHYKRLEAALQRLQSTSIETTIRADKRRQTTMFSWLDWWQHDVDEATGRSKGMKITVPNWLYQAVVEERAVLAVVPEGYALTGGIERWLYRLARRHAGKQVGGWRFTMKSLWERSGSSQPLPQFARDVRKVIARNALPEYHLELGRGQKGDEIVTLVLDPMRVTGPQRRDIAKHELLGN